MLSLPNRSTVDYWLNSDIGNSRQWPRIVGENFEDKAVVGGPGLAAARKSRPG